MKRMDDYNRPSESSSDEPKQTVDSTEPTTQTTGPLGYERPVRRESKPPKRSSGFLYGLLGVIVGALLVWLLLPNESTTKSGVNEKADGKNDIVQQERISVDI